MIFYLNDPDEIRGGQLRVYNNNNNNNNNNNWDYFDIDPKIGKLVLFRSELVAHEVTTTTIVIIIIIMIIIIIIRFSLVFLRESQSLVGSR